MPEETSPTEAPPQGWYPDGEGRTRWWDGEAWTTKTQEAGSPESQEPQEETNRVDSTTSVGPPSSGAKSDLGGRREFWRLVGVGVAALIVGTGIGIALTHRGPVENDPKYQSLKTKLDDTNAQLGVANEQIKVIADREAKVAKREDSVTAAESELKDEAAKVRKREEAVGIVEKDIAANTISGDGTYEVGKDMKPGTYKSKGGNDGQCYWQVSSDANGNNILSNNLGTGPAVATVRTGQYFQTQTCSDWVRQR